MERLSAAREHPPEFVSDEPRRPAGLLYRVGRNLWNSSTATSWLAYGNNAALFVLLTPLVLRKFSPADVAVYYLFQSFAALVATIDFGFGPTYSRLIAYGKGGLTVDEFGTVAGSAARAGMQPRWDTIEEVFRVMQFTYRRLALIGLVFALVGGPLLFYRPISATPAPIETWIAFFVVALSSARVVYRGLYNAYLRGLGHVALVNRWSAATDLLAVASGVAVMFLGGGLLELVCSTQAWALVAAGRNRWLALQVDGQRMRSFHPVGALNKPLFQLAWSRAWRTGLGTAILNGFSQSMGIAIAQVMDPAVVAGYMFVDRMVARIKTFAMAGFNPKIPKMAALRAAGRVAEQVRMAKKSMRLTHWAFAILTVLFLTNANWVLQVVGSTVALPSLLLCALLVLKEHLLRFSRMHMEIYQLTNLVVSHRMMLMLVAGQTAFTVMLWRWLGLYAIPLGALAGTLVPMVWLCRLSYSSSSTTFWRFESDVSLLPLAIMLVMVGLGVARALGWVVLPFS